MKLVERLEVSVMKAPTSINAINDVMFIGTLISDHRVVVYRKPHVTR